MEIKVLSSGSKNGNCTWLKTAEGVNILFDIGITFKKLSKKTNYEFIHAVYVTHEHKDHADLNAIKTLLERGTNVFMTRGTKEALGLPDRYNLLTGSKIFNGFIPVHHDAAEPAAIKLYIGDEKIYYVTDTGAIDFSIDGATYLILEANHSALRLELSKIEEWRKERVKHNHLSIEKLIEKLKNTDLTKCREIHLIHVSECNGDGAEFARDLKPVVGDIPIFVEVSKP